jgi:hypothetical protein
MNLDAPRPLWKRRTFWLTLVAVMVPLGWLVLLFEAGRTAVKVRRAQSSELPADVAEWLRLRDLERERVRRRPADTPLTTAHR